MKLLIFSAFLALSVVGCSSGGGNEKNNDACDSKWKPGSLDNPKATEKVDASDSTKSLKMSAGDYSTPTVRLFYYDASEKLRIDLNVSPDAVNKKTNEVSTTYKVNCVRGVRPKMDAVSFQFPYASKMTADASGATSVEVSELSVVIDPKAKNVITVKKSESSNKSNSLKDVYPKDRDTKHILYKLNDKSYESRVQILSQGRKDTKGDERGLDFRAFVTYKKNEPKQPEETSGSGETTK